MSERATPLVGHGARGDENDVDDPPDAEAAGGDELEEAGADLAEVEAVDAERAEQNGQKQGNEEAALRGFVLVL